MIAHFSFVAAEVTRLSSLLEKIYSEPPYVGCYFFTGWYGIPHCLIIVFEMVAKKK